MELDKDMASHEPKKEEKKSGIGWASILVSIYFIVRGALYINDGLETWGSIMLFLGIVGAGWKIYDMTKNS